MGLSSVLFISLTVLMVATSLAQLLPGRSLDGSIGEAYDYEDYGKNELYPVATKRAALLLDRLMVALQKAVDEQGMSSKSDRAMMEKEPSLKIQNAGLLRSFPRKPSMDLQRRGHANGGVYWRCYFNAVTCFKRK